jgi:glutathione synthase/RimK-type ligase-like ATP-grasp enzyme
MVPPLPAISTYYLLIQKMILALSYNTYEQGSDPVIDWLLHYKANFLKVTLEDLTTTDIGYTVDVANNDILINGSSIRKDVSVIWCRRFLKELSFSGFNDHEWPVSQVKFESNGEIDYFTSYLFSSLQDKCWMPSPQAIDVNKLNALYAARKCQLAIPASVVLNNKKDLLAFYWQHPAGIISKPINHSGYYVAGKYTYSVFTNLIDEARLAEIPDYFFPSLFQERVDGEYEIRAFYLDGEFYASAVLNESEQKDVDVKLNFKSPHTHWVPYALPALLQDRLRHLMQEVGLNTGSFDIIKTRGGEYVFIEVNPVGQYSAPSYRCNYHLEKHIAEWLIKHDN